MNPIVQVRHVRDGIKIYDALGFWCPGCERPDSEGEPTGGIHILPVTGPNAWAWNGSLTVPTLTPSILTKFRLNRVEQICHSYMVEGSMQFLNDCTHALKGQTVPLLPLPDWFYREGL